MSKQAKKLELKKKINDILINMQIGNICTGGAANELLKLHKKIKKYKDISPDKLKEGQEGVIDHWINQPQYEGNKIKRENGTLVMTWKNGCKSLYLDLRFPHWCKVRVKI